MFNSVKLVHLMVGIVKLVQNPVNMALLIHQEIFMDVFQNEPLVTMLTAVTSVFNA